MLSTAKFAVVIIWCAAHASSILPSSLGSGKLVPSTTCASWNTKPKTKSDSLEVYGKQMAKGMVGMMKMFNINLNSTLKFQRPIKSIVGKHDFVKQIDSKTIQINVRTNDLLDNGKALTYKDKRIIVTTE